MAKDFSTIDTPLPLGLRNNNPGNVRPLGKRQIWVGQTGTNKGFAVFKDISYGIRAIVKNAVTQITKRGNNTVAKYVTAYAPPSQNDTQKYILAVADVLNLKPNDVIQITFDNIKNLVRIHMQTEIGSFHKNITDEDIRDGILKLYPES